MNKDTEQTTDTPDVEVPADDTPLENVDLAQESAQGLADVIGDGLKDAMRPAPTDFHTALTDAQAQFENDVQVPELMLREVAPVLQRNDLSLTQQTELALREDGGTDLVLITKLHYKGQAHLSSQVLLTDPRQIQQQRLQQAAMVLGVALLDPQQYEVSAGYQQPAAPEQASSTPKPPAPAAPPIPHGAEPSGSELVQAQIDELDEQTDSEFLARTFISFMEQASDEGHRRALSEAMIQHPEFDEDVLETVKQRRIAQVQANNN